MLNVFFKNDELKMILANGQWGYIGLPLLSHKLFAMCQMMINYLKDGAFFLWVVSRAFANAIFKKFIDFERTTLCYHQESKKILLNDNYVRGIKLQNDNEISSGLVVSNIDARQTFIDLLEGKMDSSFLKKSRG